MIAIFEARKEANTSLRYSRQRRETARKKRHNLLMAAAATFPVALVGFVVLVVQLLTVDAFQPAIIGGLLAMLPFGVIVLELLDA